MCAALRMGPEHAQLSLQRYNMAAFLRLVVRRRLREKLAGLQMPNQWWRLLSFSFRSFFFLFFAVRWGVSQVV